MKKINKTNFLNIKLKLQFRGLQIKYKESKTTKILTLKCMKNKLGGKGVYTKTTTGS